MDSVTARLFELRVIPVVKLEEAAQAAPLADALTSAGLPCLEITFRTDAAEEAIRSIADRDGLLVGAGTVVTPAQLERALSAGASFIVSPGLDEEVVTTCLAAGVPVFPGVATPTELTRAIRLGLEVVKFFPAGSLGGVAALKSIAAPFPNMRFIPTGGVNASNIRDYLALDCVPACGGSWMVPSDSIAGGDFPHIEALTREALAVIEGA